MGLLLTKFLVEVHYCMEPTPITMYLGRVTVTSDL